MVTDERLVGGAMERSLDALDKADFWANKDGPLDRELRDHMIDYHLRLAQIHAQLAVAQGLDKIIGLVFDEGRAIEVRHDTHSR
jgi:hypothetical protein